jgi:hypothetical protein
MMETAFAIVVRAGRKDNETIIVAAHDALPDQFRGNRDKSAPAAYINPAGALGRRCLNEIDPHDLPR